MTNNTLTTTDASLSPRSSIDVLTVGEAMIRFSVPVGQLIADAPQFDVGIAGAESNVAVALARMGYRSRWLSRLTTNPLGKRIVHTLTGWGVDCSQVVWTGEGRIGTYYLEFGASPRPTRVTYDRQYSAASQMAIGTFDLAQIGQTRLLHLTGITAALSNDCYRLLDTLLTNARAQGVHTVFDINFRALLWDAATCAAKLIPFMDRVDTLIMSASDARVVFGIEGKPEEVIKMLQTRFGCPQIALTTGEQGALGLYGNEWYTSEQYPVQIVDRIGAGDAFAAGVICGILENDFGSGIRLGVAMSALQLTLEGDLFRFSRDDVESLMKSGVSNRPLR